MGFSARWVLVVTAGVGVAGAFNACAKAASDDTYDLPPVTPGGSSGSGSGSGSSGGSSSGSGSGGQTEDATLSDDVVTGDDAGEAGNDDGGDAGGNAGDDAGNLPACASGQSCVDLAPSGWTGYVQLLIGAADGGADAGVGCAAPYVAPQATGLSNPVGAPADCSSCSTCLAGDAGPIQCSVGIATANLGCTANGPTTPAIADECTPVSGGNGSATAPIVSASAGTCTPGKALAPPSGLPAVSCALPGDGGVPEAGAPDAGAAAGPVCNTNQACAIPVVGPPGSPEGICIYKSGILDCPPGHFSDQHIVGNTLSDSRGCSCECNAPSCPTDGYIDGYTSGSCTGSPAITFDAGTPCKVFGNVKNSTAFIYHPSHGTFKGTCTTADAGPSGAVAIAATGATTYCCIP
jgi:hypothetical protein